VLTNIIGGKLAAHRPIYSVPVRRDRIQVSHRFCLIRTKLLRNTVGPALILGSTIPAWKIVSRPCLSISSSRQQAKLVVGWNLQLASRSSSLTDHRTLSGELRSSPIWHLRAPHQISLWRHMPEVTSQLHNEAKTDGADIEKLRKRGVGNAVGP
jgi:hypothetical protein